ncbi:hypothetical protein PSHT_05829 [Puccinia striiformis]|uniref:Uncharacterized protein n=1 Tax=Puccinia striiformis TaxID=27350 RepID=A0A2S4W9F9_9BASI|nr:hypothetical protein PSHT_05829 [Puccinia striiformis]
MLHRRPNKVAQHKPTFRWWWLCHGYRVTYSAECEAHASDEGLMGMSFSMSFTPPGTIPRFGEGNFLPLLGCPYKLPERGFLFPPSASLHDGFEAVILSAQAACFINICRQHDSLTAWLGKGDYLL